MKYSLGLDSSTQSLTAVLIDREGKIVYEKSLKYVDDSRLNCFGIDPNTCLFPPREEGDAGQPPHMFMASLDAMFEDMKKDGVDMADIAVINVSGQQHGHVYLNFDAEMDFESLWDKGSENRSLVDILGRSISYEVAPIWKTSNTEYEADQFRIAARGRGAMVRLTGSDSPLRFTGAVMRKVLRDENVLNDTAKVQLISSFIPAILIGDYDAPADIGNAAGMSLMNYKRKVWSKRMVRDLAKGVNTSEARIRSILPELVQPYDDIGTVAHYFVNKYGFDGDCLVAAGSGDNPQSKVLVSGDLLSLGTSFVYMISTDGKQFHVDGNAMYDGVGRPMLFWCRTNGAMVWDSIRAEHGFERDDYEPAERALQRTDIAENVFLWQPNDESLPKSRRFDKIGSPVVFGGEYDGIICSSLAAVATHCESQNPTAPLYVTGGATQSSEVMRRVRAIFNRPTVTIGKGGAALGAAVAGLYTLKNAETFAPEDYVDRLAAKALPRSKPVNPNPADVQRIHGEGGYMQRFTEMYDKVLNERQMK